MDVYGRWDKMGECARRLTMGGMYYLNFVMNRGDDASDIDETTLQILNI